MWRDEGPRCGGEVPGFVVAFYVADARDRRLLVEAEAFVVAFGPDRARGAKAVADGVFGALGNFGDVVFGGADDEVRVPRADVECVNVNVQSRSE